MIPCFRYLALDTLLSQVLPELHLFILHRAIPVTSDVVGSCSRLDLCLTPVIVELQLTPADTLVDSLLPVEFPYHMAYDLIPVLCMESFQIGGVALHICKIIENIRTLQRVVHTEFSHKSVVAVNVISAKQLRDVSLEKNLGIVALSKGDYTTASAKLKGAGDVNEAIANIMCGEFDAAADALKNDDSAIADYYRAVVAARKGKLKDAKKMLDSACEKDPSLREKALKDIEFVAL